MLKRQHSMFNFKMKLFKYKNRMKYTTIHDDFDAVSKEGTVIENDKTIS